MNSPIINVISGAVIKAGKGLLRDFGEVGNLQVSRKGPSNFVTKSDLRTEKLLQRELSAARPGYGFLLEEGGEVAGEDASHRWIIDPLDGTANFIHAIPYFCISVALEKRVGGKSEIIAGVVYDPIHNDLFAAEKNKGAFLNSRRLAASARGSMEEAMMTRSNPRLLSGAAHEALARSGMALRDFGAAALDLANLAAGRVDACWMPKIQPWDIAAGILLVQEAGGIVTRPDGTPADSYSPAILAANRHLHGPICKLLTGAA